MFETAVLIFVFLTLNSSAVMVFISYGKYSNEPFTQNMEFIKFARILWDI